MGSGQRAFSYRQAFEQVQSLLDGNWTVAILLALAGGPLYFTQIQTKVNSVEDAVGRHSHEVPLSRPEMSRTLKRLTERGLVARHDETVSHPKVRYELTPTGRSLLGAVVRPAAEWARDHPSAVGLFEPQSKARPRDEQAAG